MKIGLISDIHGDLDALHSALDLLEKQGVTQILCMGDLVDKGSNGDGVVKLIRELNIPCVRGNHDEDALGNQRWMREKADLSNPVVQERLLSNETIDYLTNLPFSLRFEWGDTDTIVIRLLVVHGTPFNNSEYLLTTSRSTRYQEIAHTADADVIFFGHTHTPMSALFNNIRFYNPGHVCDPKPLGLVSPRSNPNQYSPAPPSCATLTLPTFDYRVYNVLSQEQIVDIPHIE